MERRGHLVGILTNPGFRRLLAVRLAGQFGDGVFQAGLAGAVLFDPERQAHAVDVAAAFAVLLLPYSLVGPFAGVLIDRWWRRRIVTVANVVRAGAVLGVAAEIGSGVSGVAFYASALVIISISRFVLSALSAALPRVVADGELVTANAVSSTVGTVVTALGGGAAIGTRGLIGSGNADYAMIAATSLVFYLLSAAAARPFPLDALGPSHAERRRRETPAEVLRGLRAGAQHIRGIPTVARALAAIAVHRLCFGMWTVTTVLLYRNYFAGDGLFRAGLSGLSQIVAGVAVGGGLAALATPSAYRRYGPVRWPAAMFVVSAVVEAGFVSLYAPAALVLAALFLGFASQAAKISVDTLVQHHVDDSYRGRVFAIYDMLFNFALVLAAALTAAALPEDGHSRASVAAIAATWLAIAVAYVSGSRRTTASVR